MAGLISYGAYVPAVRLQRADIDATLGGRGSKGTRAVASFDEDTTSMGVSACRDALAGTDPDTIDLLIFATSTPAYMDKANAAAVHAASGLPRSALSFDAIGSVRSGVGAIAMGAQASMPTAVVLSDMRGGIAGSGDERDGGDGAAAFIFSNDGPAIATLHASISITEEFLDRWRLPESGTSNQWEERFGAEVYAPLAKAAFAEAFAKTQLAPADIDHLIVAGLHGRAVKDAVKAAGVRPEAIVADRAESLGNAGLAQMGLQLADVLDRAGSGERIMIAVLSDGVSILVLETTDALAARRAPHSVAAQTEGSMQTVRYSTFLGWRGQLEKAGQRRAPPAPPFAPPSYRRRDWKFGLVGGRCEGCNTRQMHPGRVCIRCGEIDLIRPEPMAGLVGTIFFQTVDNLAYSPSPPLIMVMVEFDGGGRLRCQMTDVDPGFEGIGQKVELTFRRFYTSNNIHNYFWKARPLRERVRAEGGSR